MRIGIITIVKVNNYGAELQAFATQKKMEMMGYDVEVIDYLYYKDWHFNEFEIVMKGKKLQLPMIDIEGIEQHSDNIYCCKCHWSVVKLIMN